MKTIEPYHNLTSDAEPEEMISISRKQVQALYSEALKSVPTCEHDRGYRIAELITLKNLFGTKCLPDDLSEVRRDLSEVRRDLSEVRRDLSEVRRDLSEPSSDDSKTELYQRSTEICDNENLTSKSEPKFKLWDLVVYDGEVHKIVGVLPCAQYHLSGHEYAVDESKLHPYTETTQTNNNMEDKEHRNLSQDSAYCDKMEDTYYCDNTLCCHNGEGYLSLMYCDKVLCNIRAPKPKRWRAESDS